MAGLEHDVGFLKSLFGGGVKSKTCSLTPPPPPSADSVARAESALGISFPASFLAFMRVSRPMKLPPCSEFYWIGEDNLGAVHIVAANRREHEDVLPRFMVMFYNDGMGNRLCFDTRRSEGGEYPIVFWDHELGEGENLAASVRRSETFESAGIVAESFPDWLKLFHEKVS